MRLQQSMRSAYVARPVYGPVGELARQGTRTMQEIEVLRIPSRRLHGVLSAGR